MRIDDETSYREATELEVMRQNLPLAGARVLELGCGTAWMTRQLAEQLRAGYIIATEVDQIQHQKTC